jgi:hypothetical protein
VLITLWNRRQPKLWAVLVMPHQMGDSFVGVHLRMEAHKHDRERKQDRDDAIKG